MFPKPNTTCGPRRSVSELRLAQATALLKVRDLDPEAHAAALAVITAARDRRLVGFAELEIVHNAALDLGL